MPLTLVTGPANSAKAAVVLDRVRASLDRAPLLVVPTRQDVDRFRRELAESGAVFGARVVRFAELVEEIAARAGVGGAPLGDAARRRVARAVVASVDLEELGAAVATTGFASAATRLFAELEVARVEPGRLAAALDLWAGEDARRRAYGRDVARLYRAWRRTLDRLGRRDPELHAIEALDALRLGLAAWDATPVALYGFDDLTPLERDVVETLATVVGADVTLSLSYEPGRRSFAGRASTFEELRPLATAHVALGARAEHYAPGARAALHGLERALFEDGAVERLSPGDAVAVIEAGGERAELELVAAEVERLLGDGVPAEEVAVVVRSPERSGPLVERVLSARGIPFSLRRRVPFGHTAPGRALLALLRCAALDGSAADLVAWLRAPGVLRRPELADRLEARVRREGLVGADAALEAWIAEGREPPRALARVRDSATAGGARLCACLTAELGRLLGPRDGAVLGAPERFDAAAVATGSRALEEIAELASAGAALAPTAAELADELAALEVVVGEEPGRGRVTVTDPLSLRARRVRALVLCGLQEGTFPRPPGAEPFLSAAERRELALASGVVLPRHDDGALGAERYLFYATASRPDERLVLSFRTATDDGTPEVASSFLGDVLELFEPELWNDRLRRPADPGAAVGARDGAATPGVGPLCSAAVLRELRERPAWSPSALEAWHRCPVRWFVERHVRAKDLEGDPEPQARGRLAHAALERTLRSLREETGSARLDPDRLEEPRQRLRAALAEAARQTPISPSPERLRAGLRRLEADLLRYMETAARGGGASEPQLFEVAFGFEDEPASLPALELAVAGAEPVRLRGRIDRVDLDPASGRAIVVDYKGRNVAPGEKWVAEGALQAALYAQAVRDLLDLEPAGALYQPIGASDGRPRGLLAEDADPDLDLVGGDRQPPERVAEVLDEVLELAARAAREARAGRLEPRPRTCTPDGACAYPSLCRCQDVA